MKKLLLLCFIIQICAASNGQTKKEINISPAHTLVEKVDRQGMQVFLELDEKTVAKAWEQKLKEFGKVESSKNAFIVQGAIIPGILTASTIYSVVLSDKNATTVFWAIDMGSQYVTQGHDYYPAMQGKLHDFAVQTYISDINSQISTAEGALSSSVKTHQKLIREGESLKKDIHHNKQEKTNLENKLKSNESELTDLNNKAVQCASKNKAAVESKNTDEQEKILKESENIRRSIEKNKQQHIELENKIKENAKELTILESETSENDKNSRKAEDEVKKMTKAVEVVKEKLKLYQ